MKGTLLFLITICTALANQSPTSTVCVEYRSANHPPSKVCGLPVPQMPNLPNLNHKEQTGRSANEQYTINFEPMKNKNCPNCGQSSYMIPSVPEARTILIPPYGYKQPKNIPNTQNTQDEKNCNDLGHSIALTPMHFQSIPQDSIYLPKTDPLTNSHITRLAMIQTEQLRTFQEQEEKLQRLENQLESLIRNAIPPQEKDVGRTITNSGPSTERNVKANVKTTTAKSD